jgi:GNAT superfamily N-acetyltransferase
MSSSTPQKVLPQGYTLVESPPPQDAYINLRTITNLTPPTPRQAAASLSGSWYFVHLIYSDPNLPQSTPILVGQGRVIGDGGWLFHIADMTVHTQHQRKGLGDFIMQTLLDKIVKEAAPNPYVNLIADVPGVRLYAKHGFVETAGTIRGSVGMERRF